MRLKCPSGMVRGQFRGRDAPSCLDRWTRGETFQTVVMERATTSIGVALTIVWYPNVPHFRVKQSVHNLAVHHRAATDSSANCQVNEVRKRLGGAPPRFSQGCSVDVSIKPHGNIERGADCANEVEVLPIQFRCRRDMAIVRRRGAQVDWPKGTDADRAKIAIGRFS